MLQAHPEEHMLLCRGPQFGSQRLWQAITTIPEKLTPFGPSSSTNLDTFAHKIKKMKNIFKVGGGAGVQSLAIDSTYPCMYIWQDLRTGWHGDRQCCIPLGLRRQCRYTR